MLVDFSFSPFTILLSLFPFLVSQIVHLFFPTYFWFIALFMALFEYYECMFRYTTTPATPLPLKSVMPFNTSDFFIFNKTSQPLSSIYMDENLQISTLQTYVLCYFQREELKSIQVEGMKTFILILENNTGW